MNNKKNHIGFQETLFSGTTKTLSTRESFIELAQRDSVADVCLNLIPEAKKNGKDIRKLKEKLPLIFFMASCEENGKQPTNETAIPTGLCMHDFDHMKEADIRTWYALNVEPLEDELGILYAGITTSGEGLRLVTTMKPCESIPQCQKRVADYLHLERDNKITNVSRGSYAVPYAYIIKLDDRLFSLPDIEVKTAEDTPVTTPTLSAENSVPTTDMTAYLDGMTTDDGLPMKEIVLRLMEQLCADGMAKEGNRETTVFKMAVQLRPLTRCDFRYTYELLAPLFRNLGLQDEEIRHAISNGISQKGGYTRNLSPMMLSITRSIRLELGSKKEPIILPPYDLLPPVVNDILSCYPQRQHMAVLVSLMGMFGTLGTGVRFRDQNREQSLTFFSAIISEFGGGKGYIDDLEHKILPGLLKAKKIAIEKAEEERKKRLENSNLQVRQKYNEYPSQILGDNITSAQLIDSLNILQEKHGFLCTEEISSLLGSMNSEYGKQIAYIVKKGFDNSPVSKETKSDSSANVYFRCFLNLVLCGTPSMVMKFFNTTAIEDGTASRFVLVDLDPGLEEFNPEYLPLTKKQQERLDKVIEMLVNIGVGKEIVNPQGETEKDVEFFPCDYLLNVVHEYYAEQIAVYREGGEVSFRKLANRAGVYALRSGMLMWFLWGCPKGMQVKKGVPQNKKMQKIGEFAKWFAEYVQNQQYRYLSRTIDVLHEKNAQLVRASHVVIKNIEICSRFAGPFSTTDFQQMKFTLTRKYDQNPSQTLNRLASNPDSPLVKCPNNATWEYKHNIM